MRLALFLVVSLSFVRDLELVSGDGCVVCKRGDGKVINLETLANTDGTPRFSVTVQGYTYSYNPCYPFKLGPAIGQDSHCQNDVALCKSVERVFLYQTIGTQSSVSCDRGSVPTLVYRHSGDEQQWRKSHVILECDPQKTSADDALFKAIDTDNRVFKLSHSTCCWTSAPAPTSKPLPNPTNPDDSKDEKVGVVAGVATCGVFIFIGLGGWIWSRIRRRRREREEERRRLLAEREAAQNANAAQNADAARNADAAQNAEAAQPVINVPRSCSRNSDIIYTKEKFNNSPDCEVNKSPVSKV